MMNILIYLLIISNGIQLCSIPVAVLIHAPRGPNPSADPQSAARKKTTSFDVHGPRTLLECKIIQLCCL